jgi:hypothetical protein
MRNLLPPASDLVSWSWQRKGALLSAYRLDIKLALLMEGGEGFFVVRVFLQHNVFNAKEVTLGAQSLGLEEIAGCLSEVVGKEAQVRFNAVEGVEGSKGGHPIVEA